MIINKKWMAVFVIYLSLIVAIIISAYLRLIPVGIKSIPYYDKIGHFVLIGIMTLILNLALYKKKVFKFVPLAIILVAVFAVGEELLQGLSPYRTCSLVDVVFDLFGICFFVYVSEVMTF